MDKYVVSKYCKNCKWCKYIGDSTNEFFCKLKYVTQIDGVGYTTTNLSSGICNDLNKKFDDIDGLFTELQGKLDAIESNINRLNDFLVI